MAAPTDRWLLPDGVIEILPPQAWRVEQLRRRLLDLFECWGYELVVPPLIEYLESLLTGSASDLDLQTFKLTDLLSGRLLGIRVDMTSQAARIDAHVLGRRGTTRLCYAGSVLHAKPAGLFENRCPLLVGAELFGAGSHHADAEVVSLAAAVLAQAEVPDARIELGHVGLFRALADAAGVAGSDAEDRLFESVQAKSDPDVIATLTAAGVEADVIDALVALTGMLGGEGVIADARARFRRWPQAVDAIDELQRIVDALPALPDNVTLQFDLSELRGYSYHTGVVFAAYTAGQGRAFMRGGRYDHVGEVFGRQRPATGFDADLLTLTGYSTAEPRDVVFAPTWSHDDAALVQQVGLLRAAGTTVLCGVADDAELLARCTRQLEWLDGRWQVTVLPAATGTNRN